MSSLQQLGFLRDVDVAKEDCHREDLAKVFLRMFPKHGPTLTFCWYREG
jgi:hypothetical protein